MLAHLEIPGMSLNLQDPLLRLTGIHPRQTGGPLFCQILTDFARGGVGPILPRVPHGVAELNILTVNCQGIGLLPKRRDVLNYLKGKGCQIYCLQDTHFSPGVDEKFVCSR